MKRAREKLNRKARPDEMKATALEQTVIERLLRSIAEEDVEIVVGVIDKRAIQRPPKDVEEIYRALVTRTIAHCVNRHPRVELCLDKRYTKALLRYTLERTIREGLAGLAQELVLIRQEDSRNSKGLQAVDHVAWAIFQKYERQDERFYRVVRAKIVVEEMLERPLWK